jgi:hypothetical protein
MDYNGEALNPTSADLLKVALHGLITKNDAVRIIEEVKASVATFRHLAQENGVPEKEISPIAQHIDAMLLLAAG